MGVVRKPLILKHNKKQTLCLSLNPLPPVNLHIATTETHSAAMDLYTLVPRTLVGVVYPAFASLKAVLHGSPESAGAWLRYWVVLGVFSLIELLLDLVINPLSYSFPTYLVVKCLFLVWCMLPVSWNGSDLLFNQVHELSDAFAKTSCSCIEDWDYEQDERVKVSYTLKRRLKILWMKLKMKMYEMIY